MLEKKYYTYFAIVFILNIFFSNIARSQKEVLYEEIFYELKSDKLDTLKSGKIFLPQKLEEDIITIYVLDGNWNYDFVKELVKFNLMWDRIPEVRIVSVPQLNRTMELTPSEDLQRFPGSGGAALFAGYIKEELIPFIDSKYGKSSSNLVIGHSFGGLFALYMLGDDPKVFQGYLAISPSTWWKDQYLYNLEYKNNLKKLAKKPFLMLTTAEFDSGETNSSNEEFINFIKKDSIDQLINFHNQVFDGENHSTNVAISIQQFLNHYFPGPELFTQISTEYEEKGIDGIKNWYQKAKEKYEYRLMFPTEAVQNLALSQIRTGKSELAVEILNWIISYDSIDANSFYILGYAQAQNGDHKRAIESYQMALERKLPERVKVVIRNSINSLRQLENDDFKMFMKSVIASEAIESSIALTKDADTVFFTRNLGRWGSRENPPSQIMMVTKNSNGWSSPKRAWFSLEKYNDSDVFVSPDGGSIFFTSNRPYPGKVGSSSDIWKLDVKNGKWSEAYPLSREINSSGMESSPVTNSRGDLYFTSTKENGLGQGDIYVAKINENGSFQKPENLNAINTKYGEWNVLISPKDEWIIFESSGRPGAKSGYGDFYISFNKNGNWQPPVSIDILNTTGSELNARLSADGKILYFASSKSMESARVDIYQISWEEIMESLN